MDLPDPALPTPNARRGGSLCPAIAHQAVAAYLEWLQTAEQVHENLYHDASKRWNTI